ncbi:hypothetical protein [Motilibacter aurantiacus]|uniref:hypothetical protein n=1 Tax=Motilibacter aurantiacus TaxID=2714955 RepID=UPI00140E39E1|nr:hypothetical protein [Motilibacter aurantiacus]NHC45202.1 hypothetical protein [Motilibacter aurantiacus]
MSAGMVAHQVAGCVLPVPADWQVVPGQPDGRLIAVEPAVEGGRPFRASLVLTVVHNGGLSFRDWQAGTDRLLPTQLAAYQLIDLERRPVGGQPGGRRLAQHVVDDAVPVTMEQWFAQAGGAGCTLTATVDTVRYDYFADLFAELADGLVVGPPPRAEAAG